jgi:hypothetical protein
MLQGSHPSLERRCKLDGQRAVRRVSALIVLLLAGVAFGVPSTVEALPLSLTSCPAYEVGQPFLPWLDPMYYTRAPNGGLESGSDDWTLSDGAVVVDGNETYRVGGDNDSHSLSLPVSSSATTTPICVALQDPTVRLFIKNTGSQWSDLEVEVLYTDAFGKVRSSTVATLIAGRTWKATAPLPFRAQLSHPPLVTDGATWVAFRFTPRGTRGDWQIDDVFVDPFKGR